jgi:4-alpha-glucanotransferase
MLRLSPDQKLAGVLVPVFALRGQNDHGIGDTAAVKEMIDWCAAPGFRVLQMLPINETGPDISPYNAISAMALDPTTIALPGGKGQVDATGPVRYRQVKALKRDLLWAAFKKDGRGWQADWLDDYTLYRALLDENGGNDNWETWPKEQQSPATVPASLLKKLAELRRFYAYVQRIAHEQWADVRRHAEAKGVALMGDIPFGVSRYSADVWANRELFDLTWSGGAPPEPAFKPDPFTAKWGQNWGIQIGRAHV